MEGCGRSKWRPEGAQNGALYNIKYYLQSILTNNELPRSECRRRNSRPCCSPPGTGFAAPDAGPHTVQPSPGQNVIRLSFLFFSFSFLAGWVGHFFALTPKQTGDTRQPCWYFRPSFVNYCPSNLLFGSPKMYTFLKQF